MINKIQCNDKCNFTSAHVCKDFITATSPGMRKEVSDFLSNEINNNLINKLDKKGIDCLIVTDGNKPPLVQLGKETDKGFQLYYVTATIDTFQNKFNRLIKLATNPEHAEKQRAKAAMREYTRANSVPTIVMPNSWPK